MLIVATPSEYSAIESAIKKLDVAPKMIAIEVQIAQVTLDGAFQFGISGMFTGKPESSANRLTSENGVGTLNFANPDLTAATCGRFSFAAESTPTATRSLR